MIYEWQDCVRFSIHLAPHVFNRKEVLLSYRQPTEILEALTYSQVLHFQGESQQRKKKKEKEKKSKQKYPNK